jgi:hypothetical protein
MPPPPFTYFHSFKTLPFAFSGFQVSHDPMKTDERVLHDATVKENSGNFSRGWDMNSTPPDY